MQIPKTGSIHLSEWQKNEFVLTSGTCLPHQKADVYRAHLTQIQYAWANSEISEASAIHLFKKYAEKCSAIIDSDKVEIGLNNHADSILALARCRQNDSDKWQSSLTTNNVLELKCVQEMAEAANKVQMCQSTAKATVRVGNGVSTSGYSTVLSKNIHRNSGYTVSLASSSNSQTPEGCSNILQNTMISAFSLAKESTTDLQQCPSQANIAVNHHKELKPSVKLSTQSVSNIFLPTTSANLGKRKACYTLEDGNTDTQLITKNQTLTTCKSAVDQGFKTAKEQLMVDQQKKNKQTQGITGVSVYGSSKRSLGTARSRNLHGKFVPPLPKNEDAEENRKLYSMSANEMNFPTDERLKNVEPKMIELIMSEIMDHGPPVKWDDIAGLEFAKTTIKEIVVWPMLRPDIFTGLRGPPKGILLFGPPGTGKTLIGKCIACQSGATFFSISASSLTSKWVGEGEKMVRALFTVARCHQPAVIFIDEIDSLLSQRGEGEHESSRRIKTEFLVQLDGATTSSEDRILVVGATNRPQEIDEAARRRLVKRLYIPLPEASARKKIVISLMSREHCTLTDHEIDAIVSQSEGYSGADMTQLCREAALGPIRSIKVIDISTITPDQVRPIAYVDFQSAFLTVRPSVSQKDLELYVNWNKTFGCGQ
ncbi:hypothetical protein GDO86_011487 [Hymenochirus boettgeri]|uniref:Fidgetin-like protein 1 n=1 Tax=Hymenochirus boettgeri TaxID=247094 RepID=A0A8T2JGN6_9PIPI|nr:hypothetical protein GDO86_011487 [Hymenochirus boettgeri]